MAWIVLNTRRVRKIGRPVLFVFQSVFFYLSRCAFVSLLLVLALLLDEP